APPRRCAAAAHPRAPAWFRYAWRIQTCPAPKVRLSLEYVTVSSCLYGETPAGATTGTVPARRQYSGCCRERPPHEAPDRALFQPGGELRPLPPELSERRHRAAQDALRTVTRR